MGYWMRLQDKDGNTGSIDYEQCAGSVTGGCETTLSITYNYSKIHCFKNLSGRFGKDVITELENLVKELGTEVSDNYWEATNGNVGFIALVMLMWSKKYSEYM